MLRKYVYNMIEEKGVVNVDNKKRCGLIRFYSFIKDHRDFSIYSFSLLSSIKKIMNRKKQYKYACC